VKASKGKGKENDIIGVDNRSKKRSREVGEDDEEPRNKRGRPHGSNNYSNADIKVLLDFIEEELPLGQRGWQAVHTKFTEWAKEGQRPDRKLTSLETKFKQLVKTPKPTGDGVCPPDVTRAHHIDQLINERAGTCDLNDTDFDDNNDDNHSLSSGQDDV
jgi:hypothetical protein